MILPRQCLLLFDILLEISVGRGVFLIRLDLVASGTFASEIDRFAIFSIVNEAEFCLLVNDCCLLYFVALTARNLNWRPFTLLSIRLLWPLYHWTFSTLYFVTISYGRFLTHARLHSKFWAIFAYYLTIFLIPNCLCGLFLYHHFLREFLLVISISLRSPGRSKLPLLLRW